MCCVSLEESTPKDLTQLEAKFSAWFTLARLSAYRSGFHAYKECAKPERFQQIFKKHKFILKLLIHQESNVDYTPRKEKNRPYN